MTRKTVEANRDRGRRVIAAVEPTTTYYLMLAAVLFGSAPSACSCAATRS